MRRCSGFGFIQQTYIFTIKCSKHTNKNFALKVNKPQHREKSSCVIKKQYSLVHTLHYNSTLISLLQYCSTQKCLEHFVCMCVRDTTLNDKEHNGQLALYRLNFNLGKLIRRCLSPLLEEASEH